VIVTISSRHMDVTPAMKTFAEQKANKLIKYYDLIQEIEVIFDAGKDRTKDTLVIGGGTVLQPLVYAAVAEAMLGAPVGESRLFFCTSAGGFKQRPVLLTPSAKAMALGALETIDRAIELGPLAPSPAEHACTWCEFRPVCGPGETQRVARKRAELSADLVFLRSRP